MIDTRYRTTLLPTFQIAENKAYINCGYNYGNGSGYGYGCDYDNGYGCGIGYTYRFDYGNGYIATVTETLTSNYCHSDTHSALYRGYTGHEHLPMFGLINCNARLYDPAIGRFLSPDPYVQNPFMSQNFNRYSYALNNPLIYSDPSGEVWWHYVIVGAFFYSMAAKNNTPEGKNDGNPGNWEWRFWKWSYFQISGGTEGGKPYVSVSGGTPDGPNPAIGYSPNKGWGAGYSQQGQTNMYYSGYENRVNNSIEQNVNNAIYEANNQYYQQNSNNSAVDLGASPGVTGQSDRYAVVPLYVIAPRQDFSGFWGSLKYYITGGEIDGYVYHKKGFAIGYAPITGIAPTPGKGVFTLQTGGNILTKSTLNALKLSKQQGNRAIHNLKNAWDLPPNAHYKIMSDGSYVNPHTGFNYGSLLDYLY